MMGCCSSLNNKSPSHHYGYSLIDLLWLTASVAVIALLINIIGHKGNFKEILAGIWVGAIILLVLIGCVARIVLLLKKKSKDKQG